MAQAALSAAAAAERVRTEGAVILDLRPAPAFCTGQAAGAINVAYSEKSLAERVAAVVPADAPPLLLAADEEQADSAAALLSAAGRAILGRVARCREFGCVVHRASYIKRRSFGSAIAARPILLM